MKRGKDMPREATPPTPWHGEQRGRARFASLRGSLEVACEERPAWDVVAPRTYMHVRRKGRFLPGVGSVRVKGPILFRGG